MAIVTHLERELELNGLEEGDDIPVPIMSTAPTATRSGTGLLTSGVDPNVTCNYCKKPGHVKDDCRKLKESNKLDLPRLQMNEKLRVRQYIISDPSNIYYTEYYTALKETSSADWQQQIRTPPNFHTTLDPISNRLQNDT